MQICLGEILCILYVLSSLLLFFQSYNPFYMICSFLWLRPLTPKFCIHNILCKITCSLNWSHTVVLCTFCRYCLSCAFLVLWFDKVVSCSFVPQARYAFIMLICFSLMIGVETFCFALWTDTGLHREVNDWLGSFWTWNKRDIGFY